MSTLELARFQLRIPQRLIILFRRNGKRRANAGRARRNLARLVLAAGALLIPNAAAAAARPAAAPPVPDAFWHSSVPIYNSSGYIADAYLWLNLSSGEVHAEVSSPFGAIGGSVIKLQTSGYINFSNVPHSWPNTVTAGASYVNTGNVRYNEFGNNWWWRACGYVGSGKACTYSWKFTYSTTVGWQETQGLPQTP